MSHKPDISAQHWLVTRAYRVIGVDRTDMALQDRYRTGRIFGSIGLDWKAFLGTGVRPWRKMTARRKSTSES